VNKAARKLAADVGPGRTLPRTRAPRRASRTSSPRGAPGPPAAPCTAADALQTPRAQAASGPPGAGGPRTARRRRDDRQGRSHSGRRRRPPRLRAAAHVRMARRAHHVLADGQPEHPQPSRGIRSSRAQSSSRICAQSATGCGGPTLPSVHLSRQCHGTSAIRLAPPLRWVDAEQNEGGSSMELELELAVVRVRAQRAPSLY